jgi:hypothetical protein
MKYLIIFIAGIVNDLMITQYTVDVVNKCMWRAVIVSGLITLVNFFFLTVIVRESITSSFISICIYAFGNIVGTYIVLKRNKHAKNR